MIKEEQIADLFADFVQSGNGSNELKQIYETLPYVNYSQMRVLTLYRTLAKKYDSVVFQEMADSITTFLQENRKTGFSFTKRIEAMALYKHFNGYRATGNMNEDKK